MLGVTLTTGHKKSHICFKISNLQFLSTTMQGNSGITSYPVVSKYEAHLENGYQSLETEGLISPFEFS